MADEGVVREGLAPGSLTELLQKWSEGDDRALEALVPLVDAELRRIASRFLRRERPNPTLSLAMGKARRYWMVLEMASAMIPRTRTAVAAARCRLMGKMYSSAPQIDSS